MNSRKKRGFSLLELLIVIGIGLTMAGVTFVAMKPLFNENHVDSAYDTTLSVIRNYRNLSITQSKRYILTFAAPGTITVQYWGVGVPVSPAPVTVATYTLPPDIQFALPLLTPSALASPRLTSTKAWGWAAKTTLCSCPMGLRRTRWETTTAALST
jgi:prepilin-type N-terminal cleavage/methylation domain-containing protein